MKALQVLYTSCKRGQSSGSGFQIRSATAGLSADELAEIARLGNYSAPGGVDFTDIRRLPVGLRYTRLSSGRYSLIRSSYSGRDYSGRDGNFFAHTLVPEQGPLPCRMTDYMSWPGWKTSLAPEEDTLEVPGPLPVVEVQAESGAGRAHRSFAAAHPRGRSLLARMLAALFLGSSTNRRIVLRARAGDGWRWISCLLDLVPLATAQDISISTYQSSPIDAADINATVEGSGFSFNATQRDYEFFLFDLANDITSAIPEDQPSYAAARDYAGKVVAWYFDEPDRLDSFFSFMTAFEACPAEQPLLEGFALFEFSSSRTAISPADCDRALKFVGQHARAGFRARALSIALDVLTRATHRSFEALDQVVRMCIAAGDHGSDDAQAAEVASRTWIALFNLGLEDPPRYEAAVRRSWQALATRFPSGPMASLLLDDDEMATIRSACADNDAGTMMAIPFVMTCLRATFHGPVAESPHVHDLVDLAFACRSPGAPLAALFDEPADMAETAGLLAYIDAAAARAGLSREPVVQCLGKAMTLHPSREWQLRERLFAGGLKALLLAEFLAKLAGGARRRTYEQYMANAMASASEYFVSEQVSLAAAFWRVLDERERGDQAHQWLHDNTLPPFPRETLVQVATSANARLPLDPADRDSDLVSRALSQLAKSSGCRLTPDRPALRELLGELQTFPKPRDLVDWFGEFGDDLQALEYEFVLKFSRQKLPFAQLDSVSLAAVAQALFADRHRKVFEAVFGAISLDLLKARGAARERAPILVAWILLSTNGGPPTQSSRRVLDGLAHYLASRKDSEMLAILDAVRELAPRSPQIASALKQFGRNVEDGKSSISNTMRRFGRKMLTRLNPF